MSVALSSTLPKLKAEQEIDTIITHIQKAPDNVWFGHNFEVIHRTRLTDWIYYIFDYLLGLPLCNKLWGYDHKVALLEFSGLIDQIVLQQYGFEHVASKVFQKTVSKLNQSMPASACHVCLPQLLEFSKIEKDPASLDKELEQASGYVCLCFKGCRGLSKAHFEVLAKHADKILSLRLIDVAHLKNEDFEPLKALRLVSFSIEKSPARPSPTAGLRQKQAYDGECLRYISSENLTECNLTGLDQLSQDQLQSLQRAQLNVFTLPQITNRETFYLDGFDLDTLRHFGCHNPTTPLLEALETAPLLETLQITTDYGLRAENVDALTRLSSLKRLCLQSNHSLSDTLDLLDEEEYKEIYERLDHLVLEGLVSKDQLELLLKKFPNLHLCISRNSAINEREFANLRQTYQDRCIIQDSLKSKGNEHLLIAEETDDDEEDDANSTDSSPSRRSSTHQSTENPYAVLHGDSSDEEDGEDY